MEFEDKDRVAAKTPPSYEAPRIVSHSAEVLRGMTINVNACSSGFGSDPLSNSEAQEGDGPVTY